MSGWDAMSNQRVQPQMYGVNDPSMAQRTVLAAIAGCCAAMAWWLLFGGGIAVVGTWFGRRWASGDTTRRMCLAAALSTYFIRLLFTEFVFLKRGVSWTEVFTIVPWVFFIYLLLAVSGGTNPDQFGIGSSAGALLFVLGSWINSHAEYARYAWKQQPQNRGKLYILGMFRYTRHPNYLGDLISFSGLCLMAARWFTGIIPILMFAGFIFVNIPALDAHLHQHYGAAFDEYAQRTRKLIPFVY